MPEADGNRSDSTLWAVTDSRAYHNDGLCVHCGVTSSIYKSILKAIKAALRLY
jgi:hypothetical protein